jgi:hypothetical protein
MREAVASKLAEPDGRGGSSKIALAKINHSCIERLLGNATLSEEGDGKWRKRRTECRLDSSSQGSLHASDNELRLEAGNVCLQISLKQEVPLQCEDLIISFCRHKRPSVLLLQPGDLP